jgi:hypothetical protein
MGAKIQLVDPTNNNGLQMLIKGSKCKGKEKAIPLQAWTDPEG